jgi:hypothetical protein
MQDPFPLPPQAVVHAWRETADILGLSTLPLHVHEVLIAWAFYQILYASVAPILSRFFCPKIYPQLPARTRVAWNIRFVSTIQAVIVSSCALWVIFNDRERAEMDWIGRIWGYTGAMGFTQALAAGYFLWDFGVSAKHIKILGPGSLAHAISALLVTTIGFVSFFKADTQHAFCLFPWLSSNKLLIHLEAPLREFLWPQFRPLCPLDPLPQHALVF